ncbi:MAG TPA: dephospho-CoA kinase [Desulfobacteraceae bacterium]|nr:dephospho-CoA kinase [Desulfobacteraceae bacterium]
MSYNIVEKLETNRKQAGPFILGVTGGIASGKTTVANMLKELGAPIIDFDLIARQIVEPGKRAWKDIVDYFSENMLLEDGNIDRRKLSNIIFNDTIKRKKLEEITHPRVFDEFHRQVTKFSGKSSEVIIQAVIPLLFEVGLERLVDSILLVYIPRERQIERLVRRDKISEQEADNILKAQLPIDEKVKHADFVIHNEISFEETRRQVKQLWQKLRVSAK